MKGFMMGNSLHQVKKEKGQKEKSQEDIAQKDNDLMRNDQAESASELNESSRLKRIRINQLMDFLPHIYDVHHETIFLDRPFEQIAACFAQEKGTVLLLSGSSQDCSNYNILGLNPWLELSYYQNRAVLRSLGDSWELEEDPFSIIQMLLDQFKLNSSKFDLPVQAGLLGYLSYDLKNKIEKLPQTCMDVYLPDLCLYAPSIILIQNKKTNETQLCIPILSNENIKASIAGIKDYFFSKTDHVFEKKPFSIDKSGFKSSYTKPEYISCVEKIISYLKAGDIYQANLSQRFESRFEGDSYSLFLDLFERNPASFFSFINAGDHHIVSTSPERFIKQNGRSVETRPIKGTIARGNTPEEDTERGVELSSSIKDDAELTMIVDLMRNDLSRVTKDGSVIVKDHKRLEPYENVYHLVSIVEGRLLANKSSVDFLKATFPGGSITGCPKIRSMEIIDELEPVKRHVYTGSIGYISFHDTMDLSIAIRTATITDRHVYFSVGGGIVYDSDPEKEYQETLDKGKTLMESLSGTLDKNPLPISKVWVDGKIIDEDKAMVSASSTGFQYGAGLFETIRVDQGKIHLLDEHITRLKKSWESLFAVSFPEITWKDVIALLIKENKYQNKCLAVKVLISLDDQTNGKKVFLAAFARPYTHRLEMLQKEGLELRTYPYPRQTPLADHKTLNYLYYSKAGDYAKEKGADEALILNPDQTISETNTANLLAIKNKTIFIPKSDHVLGGVTLKTVLTILIEKGYDVCEKMMSFDELFSYPNIILTNALMGAVKVLSIDGKQIEHQIGVCSMINEQLFGE